MLFQLTSTGLFSSKTQSLKGHFVEYIYTCKHDKMKTALFIISDILYFNTIREVPHRIQIFSIKIFVAYYVENRHVCIHIIQLAIGANLILWIANIWFHVFRFMFYNQQSTYGQFDACTRFPARISKSNKHLFDNHRYFLQLKSLLRSKECSW